MKVRSTIFILLLFSGICSEAQVLNRDSLISEFKYFTKLLEETHPDPYSEFGGKVEFHKQAFEIGQKIKSNDYTLNHYQDIIASFISVLHDGHSFISYNQNTDLNKYIPLTLRTIPDGMILKGLPTSEKKYLGSKLISIDGVSLDSLCNKISKISPSENKYGEYNSLEYMVYKPSQLMQLFPSLNTKGRVIVGIQKPDGDTTEIKLSLTDNKRWYNTEFSILPKQCKLSKDNYLYYSLLDGENAMYLRIKSIMARENFIVMKEQRWPSFENQLKNFYQWTLKEEMPENIDEAVSKLPCLAEVFRDMLTEMKNNNAQNLIIDLRGNGGGWTPIIQPTLYMLYGNSFLNENMNIHYYQMISPLLLKKKGTSLDQFNHNNESDYQYGDYIFSNPKNNDLTIEDKQSIFVNRAIGDGGEYIKDLNGKPVYRPDNIYAITDVGTFSAAFHYAFYLWKMGAKIVGVPSSQSPNTYMEVTEFELPYTKLKGSISNSAQYYLPVNDNRAKVFWPDIMLEYNDYKKYNFDQDAEVLWLLDYLKEK